MEKEFISLSSQISTVLNPFNIRTWQLPASHQESILPDSLNVVHLKFPKRYFKAKKKIKNSTTPSYGVRFDPKVKKSCAPHDLYTRCVRIQRKPQNIKTQSIVREKIIEVREKLRQHSCHVENQTVNPENNEIIRFPSPTEIGQVQQASPFPSSEVVFPPTRKIIDSKRPKSGKFINETQLIKPSPLPQNYNPRSLEEQPKHQYSFFGIGNVDDGILLDQPAEDEIASRQCCCKFHPEQVPVFVSTKVDAENDEFLHLNVDIPSEADGNNSELLNINYAYMEKNLVPRSITNDGIKVKLFSEFKCEKSPGNIQKTSNYKGHHRPKAVAMLFAAYAYNFIRPAYEWNMSTMFQIMQLGKTLHEKSVSLNYENLDSDFHIETHMIIRKIHVNVDCGKPVFIGTIATTESNLPKSLRFFFHDSLAAIFACEDKFFLIWKHCKYYYFFDPHGRSRDTLDPDDNAGCAVLITCATLLDVIHLIQHNSDFQSNATFELYELQLKSFNLLHDVENEIPKAKRKKHYAVVNKNYAIIHGRDGLPTRSKLKLNPSTLISCLARIYSNIHPARFWTKSVIDQLQKYAFDAFNHQCRVERLKAYNVSHLPKTHRLGSYITDISITPFFASGRVGNCVDFRSSQLAATVCSLFEKYDTALFQVDSFNIVAWKDSNFFYVYDPFRRSLNGTAIMGNQRGSACLQIHLSLRSLCSILYNNARSMASEGVFFIHAMEIIKTRISHQSKLNAEKTSLSFLLFDYPAKCKNITGSSDPSQKFGSMPQTRLYANCLSKLSVSPCERTCTGANLSEAERKEKAMLTKMSHLKAIHPESAISLPASQKLECFDTYDVILPILNYFLEICFKGTQDTLKVSKACKVKPDQHKSNREVELGDDYDKFFVEYRTSPNNNVYTVSLQEELEIKTSFEIMPDGNWILSASILTDNGDVNQQKCLMYAFIASILACRYNIKFWNRKLIDYVLEVADNLHKSAPIAGNVMDFLLRFKMRRIQIEEKVFMVSVKQLRVGPAYDLQHMLEKAFESHHNLILLFNTFGCSIFKRNVFYYLFVGVPCDVMGFRTDGNGLACLVRSLDLESIIRRVHANRICTVNDQKGVILGVKIKEILKPSNEKLIYLREKYNQGKVREREEIKILSLEDEPAEELEQSQFDEKAAYVNMTKEELTFYKTKKATYISPQIKHFFKTDPYKRTLQSKDSKLGYHYYQPDYNLKIQGTTALEGPRSVGNINEVRCCHFSAIYAIMFAIHRPIAKWDFRQVDVVIENAILLDNTIQFKKLCPSRKLDNIIIGDRRYGIEVNEYTIDQDQWKIPIEVSIRRALQKRKHFLVHFENSTFAVYKDDYFHLFDSYATLHTINESNSIYKPARLKKIKALRDRNTASWVVFPNLEHMLTYIEERVTSPNWKSDFHLYIINIILTRKVSKQKRLAQILSITHPIDRDLYKSQYQLKDLQPEKVVWLEIFDGLVPWSPLHPVNLNNEKRGMPTTKWKGFHIEFRDKLFSLWGHIHPKAAVFGDRCGKQYQAINVLMSCMALVYHVEEWTPSVLNSIVVYGDKYFKESVSSIDYTNYEVALEDLKSEFSMGKLCEFYIHVEKVVYGILYETRKNVFNLSQALSYFFINHKFGIIQCMTKTLGFGKTKAGYFMFDCQSFGKPLFESNQGCAYLMLAATLDILLYCMTVTLRVPYYDIEFFIHAITPTLTIPNDSGNKTVPIATNDAFAEDNRKSNEEIQQISAPTEAEMIDPVTELDLQPDDILANEENSSQTN